MARRVVVASAWMDYEAAGLKLRRQPQRRERVVNAFTKRNAAQSCESTCARQAGHAEPARSDRIHGILFVEICQLMTPDADRLVTGTAIVLDVFFKRPPKGRH